MPPWKTPDYFDTAGVSYSWMWTSPPWSRPQEFTHGNSGGMGEFRDQVHWPLWTAQILAVVFVLVAGAVISGLCRRRRLNEQLQPLVE
jgi:hypothetical protein